MAQLIRSVLAIERSLVEEGFRVSKATAASDYVVSVRRTSENSAAYLICRAGRNGELSASLWLTPIDFPDDRVSRIGIGFSIGVYELPIGDETVFMTVVLKKLRLIAKVLDEIGLTVERELGEPCARTRRLPRYLRERRLFKDIALWAKASRNQAWNDLLAVGLDDIEDIGVFRDRVQNALPAFAIDDGVDLDGLPTDSRRLGGLVFEQLYAECAAAPQIKF